MIQYLRIQLIKSEKFHSKIITAKTKKKKYYDKQGNLITNPDLIQDIKQGKTVIRYDEKKSGKESSHIVRKKIV